MADTKLVVLNGDGASAHVDVRTEASNGEGRQVIVIGDPSINANVGAVASQDVAASDQTTPAVLVRVAGSASINFAGGSTTGAVYIAQTAGTLAVKFGEEPTVIASGKDGTTTRPLRMNSDGAIKVYDLSAGTVSISNSPTLTGITNSVAVHLLSTAGTVAVKLDPGYNVVNAAHTIVIPRTVSGTFNGVSDLGLTLVSPDSGNNIKVFAIALTTTAQVHVSSRFTNGAGSATEFWRYALQAPSAGIAGANLAVTPPGYLFATGVNTTLALHLNTASLVHYSIGYFKESA